MAFSPLLQVVIVKKACKRGGHGHPWTPLGYAYAIDTFQIKVMEPFINKKLQGGGGGNPGEFDIFTRAKVKSPTPGHLEKVKFPALGTTFCPKQVLAMSNSRPEGRTQVSKSPPREKLAESISRR